MNEALRIRVDAAVATYGQADALDRQALANARRRLRNLESHNRVPLNEVERVLSDGRPLQREPSNQVRWVDPESGGEIVMPLDGASSLLVSVLPSTDRRLVFPRPGPGFETVTLCRRLVYICMYTVWGFLFFFAVTGFRWVDRRRRLLWANVLLMVAAVSTSLSLLGNGYWRAWNQFFQDDAAGIGWLEIAASLLLFLLAFLYRRVEADPTARCRTCHYNLTGNLSGRCPECGTPVPVPLPHTLA